MNKDYYYKHPASSRSCTSCSAGDAVQDAMSYRVRSSFSNLTSFSFHYSDHLNYRLQQQVPVRMAKMADVAGLLSRQAVADVWVGWTVAFVTLCVCECVCPCSKRKMT